METSRRYQNIKKQAAAAMLCALAYVAVAVIRVPVMLFLSYEPKDVVIVIGGFILGPLTALTIATVVSVLEMITLSDTWLIGCVMNVLSSSSFACTAAFVYRKHHSKSGAVLGLFAGVMAMTAVMLLWNYLVTPMFMNVNRAEVAKLLLPVFLPFNLVKGGINAAIVLLIYKPVAGALRGAELIPADGDPHVTRSIGLAVLAVAVLVSCLLLILIKRGVI